MKTVLSQRETPLKNWPPVEWHFIQKKTAPASFEFPALEDVPGLNPCSILEYRLHECQIQTIQRPSKMIVNTVRRMIDAFQFTSDDVVLTTTDYKRDSGLFFAVMLPIISGCQSIIFPFNVTKQKPEHWIATTVKYGVTTFCTTSRQFGMANINVVAEKAKRKKKPLPGRGNFVVSNDNLNVQI